MAEGRLLTLWACHGWEDFSLDLSPRAARSLMGCWTATWHPQLLHEFRSIPAFFRHDRWDTCDGDQTLLTVPNGIFDRMPEESRSQLTARFARFATGADRDQTLQQLGLHESGVLTKPAPPAGFGSPPEPLTATGSGDALPRHPASTFKAGSPDPRLTSHFFALGYAWLQLHLMTRQIRFGGEFEREPFEIALLAAADAWAAGSEEAAIRASLQNCFDLLLQERCRFYPSDACLYDLILADPILDPPSLAAELNRSRPVNLLCPAANLQPLFQSQPGWTGTWNSRKEAGKLSIVTSGQSPIEPLAGHLSSRIRSLAIGRAAWQQWLGKPAAVFGQRTAGQCPVDPALARAFGFQLALHADFEGRKLPAFSSPSVLWQAPDGQELPAVARPPLDAGRDDQLLKLGAEIGDQVDSWHSAHVVLAHWPQVHAPAWQDLLTTMEYGNLLGKFRTLSSAAQSIRQQSYAESHDADEYDSWPRFANRKAASDRAEVLRSYWLWLPQLLELRRAAALTKLVSVSLNGWWEQSERAGDLLLEWLGATTPDLARADSIGNLLLELRQSLVAALQQTWASTAADQPNQLTEARRLVLNPSLCSQTRVISIDHPRSVESGSTPRNPAYDDSFSQAAPDDRSPIRWCQSEPTRTTWLTRLPAAGAVVLQPPAGAAGKGKRKPPPLKNRTSLDNELFQVEINRRTGSIAAIRLPGQRGSLGSHRFSFRSPPSTPGSAADYADLTLDSLDFHDLGAVEAVCVSRGQMSLGSRLVAGFEQTIRVVRGSPLIRLQLEIRPQSPLDGDPWQQYFCSRLAWPDEMAARFRWLQERRWRCCLERFTSPRCVEIEAEGQRLALFPMGNLWHRQSALNILDTVLMESPLNRQAGGESPAQRFELAIGVNPANPLESADQLACPAWSVPGIAENIRDFRLIAGAESGLHWYDGDWIRKSPQSAADRNDDSVTGEAGSPYSAAERNGETGMLLHLCESRGTAGETTLRFPIPLSHAELRDPAGNRSGEATVDGSAVRFSWNKGAVFSLAVFWKQ